MVVIDIRKDPRIDMEMAQSIGNILKSVGQAEQNRQKRFKIDKLMTGINEGVDPMQAIQDANQAEAPRDKGLAGVWQSAGRLIGGAPRDVDITDDAVEKLLMGNLQQKIRESDPLYQAQVEGASLRNVGTQQDITQREKTNPLAVEAAKLRNVGETQRQAQREVMDPLAAETARVNIAGAKQRQAQRAESFPIEIQQKRQAIEDGALKMGWAAEDAKRKAENFTMQQKLFDDQQAGKVSDDMYKARKRVLELEGMELDNKYKVARTAATQSGAKISDNLIKWQAQLDRVENMTPDLLREWTSRADKGGLVLNKVDVANYGTAVKGKDGKMYRKSDTDQTRPLTPQYKYQLSRKPEAEQSPAPQSDNNVILKDASGRVVGSMPDLPDKTYVEIEGKTFTIPNDQLNDFRAAYPKANVYETTKQRD